MDSLNLADVLTSPPLRFPAGDTATLYLGLPGYTEYKASAEALQAAEESKREALEAYRAR